MKEMFEVHEEDAHDDTLINMETSNQIRTRAQMRAAENTANPHILEPTDVDNDTNLPLHVRKPSCRCVGVCVYIYIYIYQHMILHFFNI